MNLNRKLTEWQTKSLISDEQAKAIKKYEKSKSMPIFISSLLILAFFCIGLGIISLIASNWYLIPDIVKLCGDFILLTAVAVATFIFKEQARTKLYEAFLIFYSILILASIGLISQVYQLRPVGLEAYLLWSILCAPLLCYVHKVILPLVWLPVFTISTIDFMNSFNIVHKIVRLVERSFPFAISIIGILLLAFLYRILTINFRTKLAMLIKAIKFWLVVEIVIVVLFMDFGVDVDTIFYGMNIYENYLSVVIIAISGLMVFGFNYLSHKHNYSHLLAWMMSVLLVFSLIYTLLPHTILISKIWGFLLSMAVLCCLSAFALIKNRHDLLKLATGLMALRFFIVYLQVFGSLLDTGLGLIISGGLFLLLIVAWNKLQLEKYIIVKEPKQ